MTIEDLKNKPLVEAIFELRWELQEQTGGMKIDPHYKVLIGTVYDKVKSEYPFHEQLPTATMPDEMSGYIVQHRFRKGKDEWPLIQIGPGIITLNDTDGYVWKDFEKRISFVINTIFGIHLNPRNLKVNGLILRYIDVIDFDYNKDNAFNFLKEKMKINVNVYQKLFVNTGVSKLPKGFDLRFFFPSAKPKGDVGLRFVRGKRKEVDALIWETTVQSTGKNLPDTKKKITIWVENAHKLTHDWFFKIIEGELLRRFE